MGRHRRSGPHAAPVIDISAGRGRRGAHRRTGRSRTGLVSASAALTVGAVAAGTGLLPGVAERLAPGDSGIRAQEQRRAPLPLGGPSPTPTLQPEGGAGERTGEPPERQRRPEAEPSGPAEETTRPAGDAPSSRAPAEPSGPPSQESASPSPSASPTPTADEPEPEPEPSSPPAADEPSPADPEAAAADAVLTLVNEERALAGCQPLVRDDGLSRLASDFSRDMAERGFFSHTDPDGDDPWDRAQAAGIGYLGGENIARGQAGAQAVMDAWMASEGHRANILNCDFRTLGVGVHIADGGPWWTQDFGY